MDTLKLLLIDDDEQMQRDLVDSNDAVSVDGIHADIVFANNLGEAKNKLCQIGENFYDGVILDLKLEKETDGEDILKELDRLHIRLPIVVLTGTPEELDEYSKPFCLRVYKKGSVEFVDIFTLFHQFKQIGLLRVIGGNGTFEDLLKKAFDNCLQPRFDEWVSLCRQTGNSVETEKAILRYLFDCMKMLVGAESPTIHPEECYIPVDEKTGAILASGLLVKNEGDTGSVAYFLVLSPACDLAMHDGRCKTDCFHLVPIESEPLTSAEGSNGKKKELLFNKKDFYHWIPKTDLFPGGVLNFRKIIHCPLEQFGRDYRSMNMFVAPEVFKNIQARFAGYFARQGQPDIDSTRFL